MAWVYLDDQFPDHPKIALAGGDAGWMFVCGLAYARRNETEGRIPKPHVARLTDRKSPSRLAAKLVDVGLWEDGGDFFLIHDYHEWNKPAASRKAAAMKAANARWKSERNANASEPQSESIPDADADRCPNPLPPSPVVKSSSSEPLSRPAGSEETDSISADVWRLLAQFDAEAFSAKGGVIRSKAWFATAAETRRTAHEHHLVELAAEHADWTAEQLAQAILDGASSGLISVDNRAGAAQRARIEEGNRRLRGEACEPCEGSGWLFADDGIAHACPTCRPDDARLEEAS